MHDFVVIMKADPPGHPVAQDRAQHSAQPRRKQADVTGADHSAQRDEQNSARHDEGNAYEGFGKGDNEGDGKAPVGMGPGSFGEPNASIMYEPMENAEKHAPTCSFLAADFGPAADIACLAPTSQSPGQFRQISSAA